jgi:hypothetical protein
MAEGAVRSVGFALNPARGGSAVERWGPLLVVIVWLAMSVGLFFGLAPDNNLTMGIYGTISVLAGAYVGVEGASAAKSV